MKYDFKDKLGELYLVEYLIRRVLETYVVMDEEELEDIEEFEYKNFKEWGLNKICCWMEDYENYFSEDFCEFIDSLSEDNYDYYNNMIDLRLNELNKIIEWKYNK